ncbi:hypothetical protein ACQCN2_18475 [Brevibacillus ginsengisoli]|uniref:hypothetical protein n=1 Tax=Brevibacillus ginsengisoli TaxID=363854 RepID=UPI003CF35DEE
MSERTIIVEGKTDKERLRLVLAEPVLIICTNGSYSANKSEELLTRIPESSEIYIFTDEDESGLKLRGQLQEDFPHATHLRTKKSFAQVAHTPLPELAEILLKAGFLIQQSQSA